MVTKNSEKRGFKKRSLSLFAFRIILFFHLSTQSAGLVERADTVRAVVGA
jgi:hypothetical protein